jgi:hypothetical protein
MFIYLTYNDLVQQEIFICPPIASQAILLIFQPHQHSKRQ